MQRTAGIVVHPADAVPTPGATIVLALPIGPVWITAPCRVTDVVDEPGRAGFTYATLPGHPEEGVETFLVVNGQVVVPAGGQVKVPTPRG
jgi:uncharacterized protein (UPF0548 family)